MYQLAGLCCIGFSSYEPQIFPRLVSELVLASQQSRTVLGPDQQKKYALHTSDSSSVWAFSSEVVGSQKELLGE